MRLSDVLANVTRITGIEPVLRRGSYKCRCVHPDHNDNKPSMEITWLGDESNGHFKVNCWVCGCAKELWRICAGIEHAKVKPINETIKKKFKKSVEDKEPPWERVRNENFVAHQYHDLDGRPLHQKIKFGKGDFTYRYKQDDHWGWRYGSIAHHPQVLYNAHLIASNQTIYIVEGEKDSDNGVLAYGLPFVSGRNGAYGTKLANWRTNNIKWYEEYNELFIGKDVVLICDNDRVGRVHMSYIAWSLHPYANSITFIRKLVDELGGDLTDYIEMGNNVKSFTDIVNQHWNNWHVEGYYNKVTEALRGNKNIQ